MAGGIKLLGHRVADGGNGGVFLGAAAEAIAVIDRQEIRRLAAGPDDRHIVAAAVFAATGFIASLPAAG